MRPIYERVLRRSGVLRHKNPKVYDMAGGGGILFQVARDLRGEGWEDYHLVDSNGEVLEFARKAGVRHAHKGSVIPPPENIRGVDHAFFLFPGVSGRGGIRILEATAPRLRRGGRITLLGAIGKESEGAPRESPSRDLRLVHEETLGLTARQLEVLRRYEDFKITDWRNGLKLMIYEKT